MKKYFFILQIFFFIIALFFNCQANNGDNSSGSSNSSSLSNSSDPFEGVTKRDMISITGGTYNQRDTNDNSFDHTVSSFILAKYEVTYELWYKVYQWAILPANGYNFANAGKEGNDGTDGNAPTTAKYEPVTTISWRDAIVWCNAYSEMSGLTPAYTYSSATIKDSRDSNATACDNAVCNWSVNGFRLPSEGEWQYAASNKGATQYNYASGAIMPYNNAAATMDVAWYLANSGSSTHDVGTTTNSSELTLWDMSGNIIEWCWDWYASYPGSAQTNYYGAASGSFHIIRGGNWATTSYSLQVGARGTNPPDMNVASCGFRVARTN